jgi:3-phosphoshikimate 1-carboxyvinyltransferase
LDCNHIPDAAMTLAVMALYAEGTTRLTNIASWRVKETDRIAAMATELRKLGATVQEGADWIAITPPATLSDWQAADIATYDDHRMAMCFSLAAFNPARLPIRIHDPKCVAKTFPDYFETLFAVVRPATQDIPVITIDGPTASGKGTLANAVAAALGYHVLDSGALYRLVALAAERQGVSTTSAALSDSSQVAHIADIARQLDVQFVNNTVLLAGENVSDALRAEAIGMGASRVAALESVRAALLERQRAFRMLPGLVADGRDMGTVVFPDAALKVFLTADARQRAQRRYHQLLERQQPAILEDLLRAIEVRDQQDTHRAFAPLAPAKEACLLDNSTLTVAASVHAVLNWWQAKQPFSSSDSSHPTFEC